MGLRMSEEDGEPVSRHRFRWWRLGAVAGTAAVVGLAVAAQPAWSIPIGTGVAVAALLGDIIIRKGRGNDK